MKNPLAKEIKDLEEELATKESEIDHKDILKSIKDFCDERPMKIKECRDCFLGNWKEEADRTDFD